MSNTNKTPDIPVHIAQRLYQEGKQFGTDASPEALAKDQAAVQARHDAILAAKSAQGKEEVEHAKQVAEKVHKEREAEQK